MPRSCSLAVLAPHRSGGQRLGRRGQQLGRRAPLVALIAAALLLGLAPATSAPALADPTDWQGRLDAARANAGLPPVQERTDWSAAARDHARYIVTHGTLTHEQDLRLTGASEDGSWAARTGNIYGASYVAQPTRAIHSWLDSPGHARWLLHPGLREVGFGRFVDTGSTSGYVSAAVLPVLEGIDRTVAEPDRVTFPGHGSVLRTHPEEGRASAVTTLHLFRPDLDVDLAGRVEALVRVGGRSVEVAGVDLRAGYLAIRLAQPLPADAEVAVVTLVDDRYDDRWDFALSSTRAAPPIADQQRTPVLWDVPGTAHEPAIRLMAEAGVLTGYRDGSFGPGSPVTRGQSATILAERFGLVAGSEVAVPTDAVGSIHADGIRAVLSAGWMAGDDDGRFLPGAAVTRGQLATVLAAALALPADPAASATLRDVAGTTHEPAIGAAVAAGLVSGYPDGTFRPAEAVTRGQLATVLVQADEVG